MNTPRLNRLVEHLMKQHDCDIVHATNIGCALEGADSQLLRSAVVMRSVPICADDITAWLAKHGYGVDDTPLLMAS